MILCSSLVIPRYILELSIINFFFVKKYLSLPVHQIFKIFRFLGLHKTFYSYELQQNKYDDKIIHMDMVVKILIISPNDEIIF